jgi:FHS family L-fucose permease-like MFS transporter
LVIRNPYVILGLVIMIVFALFAIIKMPNYKDQEDIPSMFSTLCDLVKDKKYSLGVLAQFLNVGAMIMCWTYLYLSICRRHWN